MGSFARDRLRRLEREGGMVTLVCQECGEEFRVAEDAGPALVAYEWQQELTGASESGASGAEAAYQRTPKDVFTLLEHAHGKSWPALTKKATGESWPLTMRASGIVGLTE